MVRHCPTVHWTATWHCTRLRRIILPWCHERWDTSCMLLLTSSQYCLYSPSMLALRLSPFQVAGGLFRPAPQANKYSSLLRTQIVCIFYYSRRDEVRLPRCHPRMQRERMPAPSRADTRKCLCSLLSRRVGCIYTICTHCP
jgi:hypothetical protein